MHIITSFWKPIVWALVVTFLSLISGDEVNKIKLMHIPHLDKAAHFGMYFVFTFLLIWDYSRYKAKSISWRKIIAYSLMISIMFGGVMELFQEIHSFRRNSSVKDFIANSAGAICAAIAFRTLYAIASKLSFVIKPKNDLYL